MTIFSDDRKYRYLLARQLHGGKGVCAFLMLNPSTADEKQDDPTVTKCMKYARSWGYAQVKVVNISPLRATDSKDLRAAGPEPDDVWQRNIDMILEVAATSDILVAACGVNGTWQGRWGRILDAVENAGIPVYCLTHTAGGFPGHPLYLNDNLQPIPFQGLAR